MEIVHCDDHDDILFTFEIELLRLFPNATYRGFTNPLLAIEYVQNNPVSIFISDGNMPEMRGDMVCKQVKANGYQGFTAIISGDIYLEAKSEVDYFGFKGIGFDMLDKLAIAYREWSENSQSYATKQG